MKQTLFISYSWADSNTADKIDTVFQPTGIFVKRDIREIKFKGSIKNYMSEIRETDFVLILISDSFIKSSNCMYEMLELLKEKDYQKKILPVLIDGTKIFKPNEKIEYIKYWSEKYIELEADLKTVNTTDALELYKELKHIENIRGSIDEFLKIISDEKFLNFSKLIEQKFKPIFDYIGISDRFLLKKLFSLGSIYTVEEREIELDKIEAEFPNNAKVYAAKAINAYRENKIRNSTYFYRKSIQLDPTFASSYYNLGFNIEVFDKNFEEAKTLYEKAIELEPKNTKAYNNLAGLYSKELKEPDKAKLLYEQALEINPFDADVHYNLATLIAREFDHTAIAKSHYETAIDLNPTFVDAKHNYGMLLWNSLNLFDEAKKQFLEILEIDPHKKNTLKQLARLLEEHYKDFEVAKIYNDRFIIVEPNDAEDHYWYSTFLILYFLPKYKSEAKLHYDIACKMDISYKVDKIDMLFR